MKLHFRLHLDPSWRYRDIKHMKMELEGKKQGLRYIRKEAVKSREKHIRNLEKSLNKKLYKKL
jgi:hypothetical protein